MTYSINKLAKIAGVTVRALHHYDEVGLLSPKRELRNKYRIYTEDDLLVLQQILFYKELDFPLEEINTIIKNKKFDFSTALKNHRKMIILRKNRIDNLIKTIDKTILKINKNKNMKDEELFDAFMDKHEKEYAKETEERWGNTLAYKQSKDRVSKMSKEELKSVLRKHGEIAQELAVCMKEGVGITSSKVQSLVKKHYDGLSSFYDPNPEIYLGLANVYVDDQRFAKNYEDIEPGLAKYFSDSMKVFVKNITVDL